MECGNQMARKIIVTQTDGNTPVLTEILAEDEAQHQASSPLAYCADKVVQFLDVRDRAFVAQASGVASD